MNDLENAASCQDAVTPSPNQAEIEKVCAVTGSPSEDMAEVADAVELAKADAPVADEVPAPEEKVAEEKPAPEAAAEEAPAEEIAAVETVTEEIPADEDAADEEQTEEEKVTMRRFHEMSKQELRDVIKEYLDTDNMEAHKEVAAIKQAFFNLRNRETMEQLDAFVEGGNDPAAFSAEPDELEAEFKQLYSDFKDRRAAHLAAEESRRAENLEKKKEVLTRMEEISCDIDNVNTRFSEFQQLQNEFKSIKDVPPTAETEIWKQFQNVVERFYDNLKINKELRDFDFKKNLEAKLALIEEAKALEAVADPVASFRSLQGLHDQWRSIGPVAKEIREEIWDKFKEASTVINRRHQEYFEQRKAAEQVNEEAKTKLCEEMETIKIEDMKSFADWNAATDRIIDIQKRWKEYGFASRKANTALYARFRKACDDFFNAKTEYFQRAKEELNSNLAKKIALCEKAEALKEAGDIKKGADEVVKLQAEWKSIGSVPRKQSDAVWQRFTAACNFFFDERKRQNKERHQTENENLEKKRAIIAKLMELPKDGDRQEIMPKIKELQAEWQTIGFVPFKQKDKVFMEYRAICDELYDAYNKREARQRMSNFQNRVTELRGDGTKVSRERDRLMRVCESRRNELKTIENNMGFFMVKSSAGNSMVKDMENKIRRIKEDIKELEEKIALLNDED